MLRNQHVVRHVEHHPARLEALYDAVQLPLFLQQQELRLGRLLAVYHQDQPPLLAGLLDLFADIRRVLRNVPHLDELRTVRLLLTPS